MAVVVIVLMFVFILGDILRWYKGRSTGGGTVIAHYGQAEKKITSYDLSVARKELEVLRVLGADLLFRPYDLRLAPMQDLRMVLLGELLFSEQARGGGTLETSTILKQLVRRDKYRISDRQLNDIYKKSYPPEVYWLLLKDEARQAGIGVSREDAANQLEVIIPKLARGSTYAQMINNIVSWQGVSEEQIQQMFADVLGVLEYAKMMCSMENVTLRQIKHEASQQEETMDVDYVRFDAGTFSDGIAEPTDEQITSHFEKYRKFAPGQTSEDNPYGFGYRMPDRVALEYIAVELNDVAGIVKPPTEEEIEEYYQRSKARFTQPVPSDPNDPNSPVEQRTRSFAEVAGLISRGLMQKKMDDKAEQILQEAKTFTEANLVPDSNTGKVDAEQLKERSGDYKSAAEELTRKYAITIHTGQTGLLSPLDIRSDRCLGMLYLRGTGATAARGLTPIVFAVEGLEAGDLGPFDPAKPRMYENIGPLKDVREQTQTEGYAGKNMMLVRITGVAKAAEAESIDQSFRGQSVRLGDDEGRTKDANSVRDIVRANLKRLAAMDVARTRAEEFVEQAAKDGWDAAIEKFNELYGSKGDEPNLAKEAETFKLETYKELHRTSDVSLDSLAVRQEGDPTGYATMISSRIEGELLNKLYGLIPEDSNTLAMVPTIVAFKPTMSYYCLKSLVINRLYEENYQRNAGLQAYKEDFADAQTLAVIHYNPENILERMKYKPVKEKTKAEQDPNATGAGPLDSDREG
jgi:hypothetical protein